MGCRLRLSASLQDLLHRGRVSISGLAEILARAANVGVVSENQLRAENLETFQRLRKQLKVPLASGESLDFEVMDICKALPEFLARSHALQRVYNDAIARKPPSRDSPWSVVVAFDEFCPGNKLNVFRKHSDWVMWLGVEMC